MATKVRDQAREFDIRMLRARLVQCVRELIQAGGLRLEPTMSAQFLDLAPAPPRHARTAVPPASTSACPCPRPRLGRGMDGRPWRSGKRPGDSSALRPTFLTSPSLAPEPGGGPATWTALQAGASPAPSEVTSQSSPTPGADDASTPSSRAPRPAFRR